MISWEAVKDEFQFEGSWRDIYIRPATIEDWRLIYPLLAARPGTRFTVDGSPQSLPATVNEIFAIRQSSNPALSVLVGRATILFHFFTEDDVECDLDPREITSQEDLNHLLAFVRELGDATGKRVTVTWENSHEGVIISYEPDTRQFSC